MCATKLHWISAIETTVGGGDTKKDLFFQIVLATLKPQNLIFSKDNCVESIKKSQKFEACRTFEVQGYEHEENPYFTRRRRCKNFSISGTVGRMKMIYPSF